jgi:hypothetical protein
MRKISDKGVPKCLMAVQKHDWLLHKPFWTDFSGIFNHLLTMDPYIWAWDQRTLQDTVVSVSKEVQDTEFIKHDVGACVMEHRWNCACRLYGKGCNHHSVVLHFPTNWSSIWSPNTERSFRKNPVSLRHCCPHKAAIGTSSLWSSERNTSKEESFQALMRPHLLLTGGLQHNHNDFSWMG